MKAGCYLAVLCLLTGRAFAQNDRKGERSELERSLSPQKLQQLIDARGQAEEELRRADVDRISPWIFSGFLNYGSVAIVKMGQIKLRGEKHYELELSVERILRGKLAPQIAAQCYWSPTPWPKRDPPGAQRIQPENGRRMLVSVFEPPYDASRSERRYFMGMLNLDDPAEAALLPQAQAAADMVASASVAGLGAYEKGLTSDSSAVRELAFFRLMEEEKCPGDGRCEASIVAATQTLLASKNLNERKQAVQWLELLADLIEGEPIGASTYSHFPRAPVRLLLQTAAADQNVRIGDLAFEFLAKLDFHQKANAGYCEEIVPALRAVKHYRADENYIIEKHIMGSRLSVASVCVEADE